MEIRLEEFRVQEPDEKSRLILIYISQIKQRAFCKADLPEPGSSKPPNLLLIVVPGMGGRLSAYTVEFEVAKTKGWPRARKQIKGAPHPAAPPEG